ncbi:MAG TPA: GntR family transcriptional regulator [Glycomyces sp.]|nr:GntR family transcriptional regulator [Glycomyces sp.]
MSEPAQPTATKSAFAYLRLRDMIVSGVLAPGEVINQAVIAPDIGVSTTPLREALRRLEGEGLVRLGAHRDARVAPLTAQEARDLLEMRRSLDPLAASLAAGRRTDEDLAAMRAAAAEIDALPGDLGAASLAAHRGFHAAVYRASHNALLIEALDALWDKADRYRRLALAEEGERRQGGRKSDHRRLLERVASGDADGAAELMRRHVDSSLDAKALERLDAAGERS